MNLSVVRLSGFYEHVNTSVYYYYYYYYYYYSSLFLTFFCHCLVQIFCPAENNWPQTRAGTMHFIPCGNDLFGFIRRPCSLDGVWGDVIADTCCRNCTIY